MLPLSRNAAVWIKNIQRSPLSVHELHDLGAKGGAEVEQKICSRRNGVDFEVLSE